MKQAVYNSPHGRFTIGYERKIKSIRWEPEPCRTCSGADRGAGSHPCDLSDRAFRQLVEYFEGRRRRFDLPLDPDGTAFQRAVWDALLEIPYGETRSYGEIAARIGRPGAARAVGGANNKNPIGIVIPCHRVVGSDGSLVGYGGGIEAKRRLLGLEGAFPR